MGDTSNKGDDFEMGGGCDTPLRTMHRDFRDVYMVKKIHCYIYKTSGLTTHDVLPCFESTME